MNGLSYWDFYVSFSFSGWFRGGIAWRLVGTQLRVTDKQQKQSNEWICGCLVNVTVKKSHYLGKLKLLLTHPTPSHLYTALPARPSSRNQGQGKLLNSPFHHEWVDIVWKSFLVRQIVGTKKLVFTAIFASLCCVATLISIPLPYGKALRVKDILLKRIPRLLYSSILLNHQIIQMHD